MNPKKKIAVISIIFILIILALVFLAIFPLFSNIKIKSKILSDGRRDTFLTNEKTQKIGQIRASYSAVEAGLNKIDNLFINSDFPIDVIKSWEKIAADENVSIKAISPVVMKESEKDPWKITGFQVNISSQFANFVKFLEKMENSSYLIEIQNMALSGIAEGAPQTEKTNRSADDVNATVLIKAFIK
jgi:hypothetical protein